MSEIHAHTLLNLLKETPLTREDLANHFDESTRFHTCKLNDLSLDELLTFLLKRQKIVEHQGRLAVNVERVCNH